MYKMAASSEAAAPRIAVVHVPKAAGVALMHALAQRRVPTCSLGTSAKALQQLVVDGLTLPCSCESDSCMASSNVAVQERSHDEYHSGGWGRRPTMWLALIRDPEAWFYSAVGQWCSNGLPGSGAGAHSPECGASCDDSKRGRVCVFATE